MRGAFTKINIQKTIEKKKNKYLNRLAGGKESLGCKGDRTAEMIRQKFLRMTKDKDKPVAKSLRGKIGPCKECRPFYDERKALKHEVTELNDRITLKEKLIKELK